MFVALFKNSNSISSNYIDDECVSSTSRPYEESSNEESSSESIEKVIEAKIRK